MQDANTLDSAAQGASETDKSRWVQQIRQTVNQLHDLDIVWGDVKPNNVLIDSRCQAWVVDLGWIYSPHWVDKDLQDTQSGDLQGLARLEELLQHRDSTDVITQEASLFTNI